MRETVELIVRAIVDDREAVDVREIERAPEAFTASSSRIF